MANTLCFILGLALLCGCPGSGTTSETKPAQDPKTGTGAAQHDAEPAAEQAQVLLLPAGRDPVSVRVEVARTAQEVSQGLMYRLHLADDAGMLFLFDRPQQLTFWMRNTFIPLDMIFIEPSMTVLGVVENAEPRTDTRRMVPGSSQYVLEVNAGFARRHGIAAGTQVRFEGVALDAPEATSP